MGTRNNTKGWYPRNQNCNKKERPTPTTQKPHEEPPRILYDRGRTTKQVCIHVTQESHKTNRCGLERGRNTTNSVNPLPPTPPHQAEYLKHQTQQKTTYTTKHELDTHGIVL